MIEFLVTVAISTVAAAGLIYKMYVLPLRDSVSTLTGEVNILRARIWAIVSEPEDTGDTSPNFTPEGPVLPSNGTPKQSARDRLAGN